MSVYNSGGQLQSLGREDPLEKEIATYSGIIAWKIPWMEEPGRLHSMMEKTLENPLDSKKIKPVNPKGNQS